MTTIGSTRLPDDVAAALRAATPADGALLGLLHESAAVYRGKASSEVERLRALIMVALVKAGFADALMSYAIEEFETGTDAYAIAAAARVVRAASHASPDLAPLIARAVERVRRRNEFIRFDDEDASAPITAVDEVTAALSALAPTCCATARAPANGNTPARQASSACCASAGEDARPDPMPLVGSVGSLADIELQNQDGQCMSFSELFAARVGLAAFFYTRCMTPEKCSRTVSQLGEVARLIRAGDPDDSVMVAGITYDPAYDLPARLRRYGEERRLTFDAGCQLLRTTGPFEAIRDRLQLGVGYGTSTVNRHRLELMMIGRACEIAHTSVRRLWEAEDVASRLLAMQRDRADLPA